MEERDSFETVKYKMKKVLVAMSGGVDSSIAAYLLKERGFEVEGLTMSFVSARPQAIKDARMVCRKLGIPHHVMDFSKHLEEKIIDKFISEYVDGRTPNPCVDCNRDLKFGILLEKALSIGFDFLATGHYAKIEKDYVLKKAKDRAKDQSYFLYSIKKGALKSILFPLGDLTKNEVRDIAGRIGLPIAAKPQSQDICFIPERNYHKFLSERVNNIKRGRILGLNGDVLGEHKGAFFYTIGQRGGLGIGYKHPLYVLGINTKKNEILVGEKKDLKNKGLIAEEVNLLVEDLPKTVFARIRYNHKEAKCKVLPGKGRLKVIFEKPQEAITPGQSVVFYDNDIVLGGGVIKEVVK